MQNKYRFVVVVGSLEKSNGFNNGTNKKTTKKYDTCWYAFVCM